jgi:hypothetical protein
MKRRGFNTIRGGDGMRDLIPLAHAQKISYQHLNDLPEKLELVEGDFVLSEIEKKALLLAVLTNVGLASLLKILPQESVEELRKLCCEKEEKKKRTAKRRRLTRLGENSKTRITRELEKQTDEVLRKIQERKEP